LISIVTFGFVYLLIVVIVKKRLSTYSGLISNRSSLIVKLIQESISSIREILINSSQKNEINLFSDANYELRNAQAFSGFIGNVPKIIVESSTLIAFACISFLYIKNNNAGVELIPFFGALALGAQKILPLIQNIFLSYTYIQTAKDSLIDINYFLNLETSKQIKKKKINFLNFIQLDSLSFSYDEKKNILNKIDLLINKGDKVGIIGASGTGKSTLIDILSGLLLPTSGNFIVDNKKLNLNDLSLWKNNISLISQNFYIHNLSILETLLFNVDKKTIKHNKKFTTKLDKVLSLCRCDFVKNINKSFGENAIQLSGGQKQRLALARGLMKDANIYIFDEATSALDENSEKIILRNIFEYLDKKTCIFISHNKSALKACNKIYSIKTNKVIKIK